MSDKPHITKSYVLAETALDQIKKYSISATPRNYEVWYTYTSASIPNLNRAIDDAIKKNGQISDEDFGSIYDNHLSTSKLTAKVDTISAKLAAEIDVLSVQMDAAAGSAGIYGQSLANFDAQMASIEAAKPENIKAMVAKLVHATREMQEANAALETRLVESRQQVKTLQTDLQSARTASLTDQLTLLNNRKYFDEAMDRMLAQAKETGESFSLVMTDIDHFKRFNDTFGHQTGDQVLRLVAMSLKENVKGQDVAARYGGEEFAIILPSTMLRSAITVADHIRRAVMGRELVKKSTGEQIGRITISLGVATYKVGDTAASIIERADKCLYAAKRNGRNRVICETDPEMAGELDTAESQKVA
jgi:diguanylate cyclase